MEKGIFAIIVLCFLMSFFNDTLNAQTSEPGNIFYDDFENESANKWLDMKAWGFGVWQTRDGVLVSVDSSNISQQMYSALPKFDNAIVNRDYSVLFRYQPISGENYSLTIDVRPQGWNNYKFEISKDGTIRILKNLAGKLPKSLFTSKPGQIYFDEWQWVRLDVTGEKPLCLKMKIWENKLADEPDYYNAIAIDDNPLLPQNINFALTSIQSGGAYTMIDDFHIYRQVMKFCPEQRALIKPGNEKLITSKFSESENNEYQLFQTEFRSIQDKIEKVRLRLIENFEINNLANLEVELISIEKSLSDCESPENFGFYKEKIAKDLSLAKTNLISLKENKNPYHQKIGIFMRGYRSEIDGSLQGYALFAPDSYDGKTPFPLVINLHGYDPSFSSWQENPFLPVFMPHATAQERYIVANPFGRGNTMYQNIGENDVLQVLREVKRLYNIDENRVYLTGGSMGGAGTWHIGLSFPDQFAAIAPIMGPTEFAFWNYPSTEQLSPVRKFILKQRSALSIAENALNFPMFCNHGVLDDIVPIGQSRKMVKRLNNLGYEIKYVEHPDAAHGGFKPEMDYEIYDWFENLQRNPYPKRVVYKAGSLKHAEAYWVKIDRFIDLLKFSTIDAEIISSNHIKVKTGNIAQFSLTFSNELINIKQPVKISINGKLYFQKKIPESKKLTLSAQISRQGRAIDWTEENPWEESELTKNYKLPGQIIDAYNSGFMLVYGTIGTEQQTVTNKKEAESFEQQWRSWQHVTCRMKSDVEVTADDISNYSLILFGNSSCNAITKKVNNHLPIRFEQNSIIAGEKRFSGDEVGLAMIYPNPLNRKRYVVIQAGISWQGTSSIVKRIGSEFDYIIFDSRTMGINVLQGNLTINGTPLLFGFFDQDWRLSDKYQWHGNQEIRKKITPRQLPRKNLSLTQNASIYLSEIHPDSINQWTGTVELDRNFWGYPLHINGKSIDKGISIFPNSELIYHLNGEWDTFSATVSADLNPFSNLKKNEYKAGKIQFGVYGDGDELFISRVLDVNAGSQAFEIPIRDVDKLKLVVRTQDWLPYFAQCGNWIDAKLVR